MVDFELVIPTIHSIPEAQAYTFGKGREIRLTAQDFDEWMKSRAAWEPRSTNGY